MQGKSLLQQLEDHGIGLLPMLKEIDSAEVRHAIREFISTVQAVRLLTEKFGTDEPSSLSDAAETSETTADVA
ncbi:hypothetical protein [Fulvimarina sp. MAC8]|uniref:hypothetical protein n=1 Tax=Fulvimarina sp. MAC8 TaxID=3162874 RepID=UPI0032ED6AD9